MSYNITLSNGTLLFTLADGLVDKSHTSISLIGKNAVNFGRDQNNDFVHILENFAYGAPPVNPLVGQLWFDTTNDALNFYNNGSNWQSISSIKISSSSPANAIKGQLWFNTSTNQISIGDGSVFNLIGPEVAAGFATSRMVSASIKDISGSLHPIIKCVLNNEVIAIISADDFDILYTDAIPGITHANRGITFKNGVALFGTATKGTNANALLSGIDSSSYVSASTGTAAATVVQRDLAGNTSVNTLNASYINSSNGVITGNWKINSALQPTTTSVNLGSFDLPWNRVYATAVNGVNISSAVVVANTATIGTLAFSSLKDLNNLSITSFDIDSTLSASSNSRLATQQAIKTYVDKAVSDAVAALAVKNSALQTQISGLGLPIPAGTVFYYAGSAPPQGYLIADGSAVNKSQYYNLYIALGGGGSPYGQTTQTFNLPNLLGKFIRSLGEAGRTIGSTQDSAVQSHGHLFDDIRWAEIDGAYSYNDPQLGNISVGPGAGSNRGTDYDNGVHFIKHGTYNSGGSETRPPNIALLAIIKY